MNIETKRTMLDLAGSTVLSILILLSLACLWNVEEFLLSLGALPFSFFAAFMLWAEIFVICGILRGREGGGLSLAVDGM